MPLAVLTLVLTLIFVTPGMTFANPSHVALVIGNSEYDQSISRLDNPANDARDVATSFENQGYDVTLALDMGQRDIQAQLISFRKKADASEIAVVYYAGHGIEIGGRNFIVPVDARLNDERSAALELIEIESILTQISGASKLQMLILDACRNNPFVSRMKRLDAGRNVGRGLARVTSTGSETLVAFAAAAGEVTPDGEPGGNSPFTAAFLSAMQGPPVDVRLLLGKVRDNLQSKVFNAQPAIYGSLGGGQIVINPKGEGDGATTTAQPDLSTVLMSDYLEADQANTIEMFDAFLIRYEHAREHSLYQLALEQRAKLEAARAAAAAAEAERIAKKRSAAEAELAELQQQALEAQQRLQEAKAAEDRLTLQQQSTQVTSAGQDDVEGETGESSGSVEPIALASAVIQPLDIPQPNLTPEELAALRDTSLRDLQTLLRERNCYRSGIDGIYGPGTSTGVKAIAKLAGVERQLDKDSETAEIIQFIEKVKAAPNVACPTPTVRKSKPRRATTTARARTPSTKTRTQGEDYRNKRGDFCDWFLRGNVCDSPG